VKGKRYRANNTGVMKNILYVLVRRTEDYKWWYKKYTYFVKISTRTLWNQRRGRRNRIVTQWSPFSVTTEVSYQQKDYVWCN
jgi:hypothetical protein